MTIKTLLGITAGAVFSAGLMTSSIAFAADDTIKIGMTVSSAGNYALASQSRRARR